MRINFDRLSQLAGLPVSRNKRSLYESADKSADEAYHNEKEDHDQNEGDNPIDDYLLELEGSENHEGAYAHEVEGHEEGADHNEKLDEMIEVDEAMLVQELRRAKRIMQENRRRKNLSESRRRRKHNLQEAELKRVIDEEVRNVLADLNLNSGWVYGKKTPARSRKGYTHQGSYLRGPGFR